MAVTVEGHFLKGRQGPVFVLVRRPQHASGCVLIVPPFAEEMNKCRRMVTEVALKLSALGSVVLVPDLYGTGDSAGAFSECRWAGWENDVSEVAAWSRANVAAVTGIVAIRLGARLVASVAASGTLPGVANTVFWQPVLDAGMHLTHFLRMRTAAALIASARRESVADIRARMAAGEIIEVAGYPLSGALTADLDELSVPDALPPTLGQLHWMEVTRSSEASLHSVSRGIIARWDNPGRRVATQTINGESFWASTEVVRNPELVQITVAAFRPSSGFGRAAEC